MMSAKVTITRTWLEIGADSQPLSKDRYLRIDFSDDQHLRVLLPEPGNSVQALRASLFEGLRLGDKVIAIAAAKNPQPIRCRISQALGNCSCGFGQCNKGNVL